MSIKEKEDTSEVNDDDLKEFQEFVMKTSQEIIKSMGHMIPMVFILTKEMEIDPHLAKMCHIRNDRTKEFESVERTRGENPLRNVMLTMQIPYDDTDTVFRCLMYTAKDPEKAEREFMALIQDKEISPFEEHEAKEKALETLRKMKLIGNNKDIIANFIRVACKRNKATAYIKATEAWTVSPPEGLSEQEIHAWNASRPQNMEEDPFATEAVLSFMETKDLRRIQMTPMLRENGRGSKLTGFGKITTTDENKRLNSDEDWKIRGRFFGLLNEDDGQSNNQNTRAS